LERGKEFKRGLRPLSRCTLLLAGWGTDNRRKGAGIRFGRNETNQRKIKKVKTVTKYLCDGGKYLCFGYSPPVILRTLHGNQDREIKGYTGVRENAGKAVPSIVIPREVIFMKRLMKKLRRNQEGITGLETAIILIAFVIVASVFAYVVLSAGLFSSQKAKEAVSAGIQSTMATVEIRGNIIARMVDGILADVSFCVGVPAAGSPVDFTPSGNGTQLVVVSYSDRDHYIPSVNWTIERLSYGNDDYLLDPNELFQMTVIMPTDNISIGSYDSFALEIKPPDGPVLSFERTIPSRISEYVNLH
jgi:flagellin FlaB